MEIPTLCHFTAAEAAKHDSFWNLQHNYVQQREHEAVVKLLCDKILATQDELIKAYNEIIALKTTLGNSMSKVE